MSLFPMFIELNVILISQFQTKNTPKVRFFLSNFWGAVQYGSFFHELENQRETHTGLFFRSGGPLFHELGNKKANQDPGGVFFFCLMDQKRPE